MSHSFRINGCPDRLFVMFQSVHGGLKYPVWLRKFWCSILSHWLFRLRNEKNMFFIIEDLIWNLRNLTEPKPVRLNHKILSFKAINFHSKTLILEFCRNMKIRYIAICVTCISEIRLIKEQKFSILSERFFQLLEMKLSAAVLISVTSAQMATNKFFTIG